MLSIIYFYFDDDDIINANKVCELIIHPRYNKIVVTRIFDIDSRRSYRVAFFHNDDFNSHDGLNYIDINKAKNMIQHHMIDKVICCYAYNTGIEDKYLLLPGAKFDEIQSGSDKYGINYLSKKGVM